MKAAFILSLGLCAVLALQAEDLDKVSIVQTVSADILINQRCLGQATLPLNKEYDLLGLVEGRFLLRDGKTELLVDPMATDYPERGLLRQLGLVEKRPESAVPEEPAVVIYETETETDLVAARRLAEAANPRPERSLRPINQTRYASRFYAPWAYSCSGPVIVGLPGPCLTPTPVCQPPSSGVTIVIRP